MIPRCGVQLRLLILIGAIREGLEDLGMRVVHVQRLGLDCTVFEMHGGVEQSGPYWGHQADTSQGTGGASDSYKFNVLGLTAPNSWGVGRSGQVSGVLKTLTRHASGKGRGMGVTHVQRLGLDCTGHLRRAWGGMEQSAVCWGRYADNSMVGRVTCIKSPFSSLRQWLAVQAVSTRLPFYMVKHYIVRIVHYTVGIVLMGRYQVM